MRTFEELVVEAIKSQRERRLRALPFSPLTRIKARFTNGDKNFVHDVTPIEVSGCWGPNALLP